MFGPGATGIVGAYYAVGGIDYFSKPFDPDLLRVKIGIYANIKQRADLLRNRERQRSLTTGLRDAGRSLLAACERGGPDPRVAFVLEPPGTGAHGGAGTREAGAQDHACGGPGYRAGAPCVRGGQEMGATPA